VITLVVFLIYTQVENHVLNPVIMSRTVKINPLLVLVSILVGASIGDWIGGFFGGFVAALLAIPAAGSTQVIVRAIWQSTAPPALVVPPPAPAPATASTQPVGPGSAAMPAGAEPATD
jgi:predicted PurR-regulated permease PerM